MQTLRFNVDVKAPISSVWQVFVDADLYKLWAKGFAPMTLFIGDWMVDAEITFIKPNVGGSRAIVEAIEPEQRLKIRHEVLLAKDGGSDMTLKGEMWKGTTEEYHFSELGSQTQVEVEIVTQPEFVSELEESWPRALQTLKGLVEGSNNILF